MRHKLRYHPTHRYFERLLTIPPGINNETALRCVAAGNVLAIVEGHTWLACDLASKALDYYDLPSYLGMELATNAIGTIWRAARSLTNARNVAAVLAEAIEHDIHEFIAADRLCKVPTRTQRERKAKGLPPAEAPTISRFGDMSEKQGTKILADWTDKQWRKDWSSYLELFSYRLDDILRLHCHDHLDREIVRLRHDDGCGPRSLPEIAGILGLTYKHAERRLDDIETRVYRALEKRKPTVRRAVGYSRGFSAVAA